MRPVTIIDIAKAAHVSATTVSRALSNSTRISAATRARILALCDEMHYSPNFNARSMVLGESKLLGFLQSNAKSPFMTDVSEAIECRAQELGYSILLCNSRYDVNLEQKLFSLLLGRQVDGVIISPAGDASADSILRCAPHVPVVFVNDILSQEDFSCVTCDNVRGVELGVQYLASLGHRDIVYLGRRLNSRSQCIRADTFTSVCNSLGVASRLCDNPSQRNSIEVGRTLARELFISQPVPTAIFASTDIVALGVMEAASELNIRIPEDVSLLGFDNISYAGLPRIDLTTVHQPKQEIGCAVVDILLEQIKHPDTPPVQRLIPCSLTERNTCAPPRSYRLELDVRPDGHAGRA